MAPGALLSSGTVQPLCPICSATKRWQPKRLVFSRSALTRASPQANINKASVKYSIPLASVHSVFGRRKRSGLGPETRCPSRPVFTASVDVEGSISLDEASSAPVTGSESEEEKIDEFATGTVEPPLSKVERFKPRVPGQKMRREDATVPAEALVEGAVFTGKVTTIQPFGAFVNFGAFTDGLVHISKMSTGYVSNVSDIVSLGQEVKVTILNVEQKSGRIALTMVDKEELEAKAVASKTGEASEGNDRSRFQQGLDGRPVNRGRIAGGGRQGRRDEPQKPPTKLKKGQEVEGTVKNKIRSGVFVELPENEEGFLRYSDIPGGDNMAPEASLQTGEKIKATVLRIDRGKVVLTMKPIVDISSVNRDINKGSDIGATNPFEIAFRAFNLVPAEPTGPVEVDSADVSVASPEEVAAVVEDSLAGVDEAPSEEKLLVEAVLAVADVAVAGEDVVPTETLSAPEEAVEATIEPVAAEETVEAPIEAAAPEQLVLEEAVAEKVAIAEDPVVETPTGGEEEPILVSEELEEAVAPKAEAASLQEPALEDEEQVEEVAPAAEAAAEAEEEQVEEVAPAAEAAAEAVEEQVEEVAPAVEAAPSEEPAMEEEEQVEKVTPASGVASASEEPAVDDEEQVEEVAPPAEAATWEEPAMVEEEHMEAVAPEEPAVEEAVDEKEPKVVPKEPVAGVAPEAEAAALEEPAMEEAVTEKELEVVSEESVIEAPIGGNPELASVQPPAAAAPESAATSTVQESSAEEVRAGISPALVKQLRDETGAGMMDCKRALADTNGDIENARETLRKKGLASADKKASRVASEGLVGSYIHDSRIGVLVEVNCETDFVSRGPSFKSLVEDLGMQVVACPQVQFVSVEDIPAETVDKEKEMEAQREDLMNKPEAIRSRIVDGRVSKRLNEIALLEQAFIRDDSILVKDLVKQTIAYLGENIKVRRFERYVLGEGLQKKGTDFAAEVAAQTGVKAPPPVESPNIEEKSAAAPTPEAGNKVIVSAALVKELRDQTGAGMMDCKKALASTENDMEKAVESLRKKGLASADKKASRLASEGLIGTYIHDGRIGILIEVNCETDFVARGERFKELVEDLAMQIAAYPQVQVVSVDDVPAEMVAKEKELESEKEDLASKPEAIRARIVDGRVAKRLSELALLDQPFVKDDKKLVKDILKETIAGLGENIQVRRFTRFNLGENIEKKVVDFASEVAAQSGRKA